jgi:hypothetical protein
MPTIARSRLESLAATRGWPLVSIYAPTHRAGREVAQDPVRFRQLTDEATVVLQAAGVKARRRTDLLAPARALLDDAGFWTRQRDGLAVLLAGGEMEVLRLPFPTRALAVVADRYHIKPLIPALDQVERFHVLSLSQQMVRLHECVEGEIREVRLHQVPGDLRDVVGWDWRPASLQYHAASAGGRAGQAPVFHGHGAPDEGHHAEIEAFLRAVDAGIVPLLVEAEAPLVLAGVDYLTAMYRDLTDHPAVVGPTIEGNPDDLTPHELQVRALFIMGERAGRAVRRAEAQFEEFRGGPRATTDLEAILGAALDGRVESLLVDLDTDRWGRWDEPSRQLQIHRERQAGDIDLLDLAAVLALGTGAEVHALRTGWAHASDGVAAVLRY